MHGRHLPPPGGRTMIKHISLILFLVLGLASISLMLTGRVYIVRSGSMEPALMPGDAIVLQPMEQMPHVGDIITYEQQGKLITHRVVGVQDAAVITTKGDANENADPWRVRFADIRGKMALRIPYLGCFFAFVRQPVGWLLLVILPIALILYSQGKQVWDLYQEMKREKQTLVRSSDS